MNGPVFDSFQPRKFYENRIVLSVGLLLLMLASSAFVAFLRHRSAQADIVAAEKHVTKIERKVLGTSENNRNIEGYEIGSGQQHMLLFAAIHGDEMGGADLLNQLVLEIALNPDLVSPAKKLLVIPIANPDGYYERVDKFNTNGVNLNLNFETSDWKEYGPEGTYAGRKPFSEKESQVIKEVVEQFKPDLMVAYHSHGNLVSPEDGAESAAWGQWYSQKTGYKYFDEWEYPGTATRWFTETTAKPSITVELSQDLQSDWEINKKALFALISSDQLRPDVPL